MAKTLYPINFEKIRAILKEKGVTFSSVSIDMGYSQKYLWNKAKEGRGFSGHDVKYLEQILGVPYETYKADEVPQEEKSPRRIEIELSAIMYDELRQVIVAAIKEALGNESKTN